MLGKFKQPKKATPSCHRDPPKTLQPAYRRKSRSKVQTYPQPLSQLSLLDSSMNRSTSNLKVRLRPSTTTHCSKRLVNERSTHIFTPTYSSAHSQRPSMTSKTEFPLQIDESSPVSQRSSQKKVKNILSGVYDKSRGMDYSSLRPVKQNGECKHSELIKKANEFDIENNPRLQTYDNHKLKSSGLTFAAQCLSSESNKMYECNKQNLAFQTIAIPHHSQLFIGRHTSVSQTQPLSSRTSQEADDIKSIDAFSEPQQDYVRQWSHKTEAEQKSKVNKLEKQLKKQKIQFEKKEVQLRTQIIQLQQKLLFNEDKLIKAAKSENQIIQNQRKAQALKEVLNNSNQPDLQRIKQANEREIQRINQEHSKAITDLNRRHKKEIQQISKRNQQNLQENNRKYEEQIKERETEFQNEVDIFRAQVQKYKKQIENQAQQMQSLRSSERNFSLTPRDNQPDYIKTLHSQYRGMMDKLEENHLDEIETMKRRHNLEFKRYIEEIEEEKIKWEKEMTKKIQGQFEQKKKQIVSEWQRKLRKESEADRHSKCRNSSLTSKSFKDKQQALIQEKEKTISDLAFKLDTEETASAIIARRLASVESLSSQKDEIIRSMNIQLLEMTKLDNSFQNSTVLGESDQKNSREMEKENESEKGKLGSPFKQQLSNIIMAGDLLRQREVEHSEYIKMMEKKHKQELDSLGCKLARLEAHYARLTGDFKGGAQIQNAHGDSDTANVPEVSGLIS